MLILEEIKEFDNSQSDIEEQEDKVAELEFNKEYENLEKKDFEYWEMAEDALSGSNEAFKLRKPKMPEIRGDAKMGEKDFSFATMEFKSNTERAKIKVVNFEKDPKSFAPPPKPKSNRDMVKTAQAKTENTFSAAEVEKMK